MRESFDRDLQHLLETYRPRRLLAVDPRGLAAADAYLQAHPDVETVTASGEDALSVTESSGRIDLAWVAETVEHLPKDTATTLLSRLRDLYARRLFVLVPVTGATGEQASEWDETEMLGLGFTRAARYDDEAVPSRLYHFDIDDYKITPDWLNARYWANPEMFDRYRW